MKKTLFTILFTTGMLFAQNNSISGGIYTSGGDVNFIEDNSISKEQIEIDQKIDNELLSINERNYKQYEKNYLIPLLGQAKKINKEKLPVSEKRRKCLFNAKLGLKYNKFVKLNLGVELCNKIM